MTRQYWANLALCLVLGALAIFFVTRAGSALTSKGLFVSDPGPSHEAAKILQDVVLTEFHLGERQKNMVEADFSIQNNSDQSVKNVSVYCEFFDENGMYRDRKFWKLAETIPANEQKQISSVSKRFVSKSVRIVNCTIADFQLVKDPVFTLDRHAGGDHEGGPETGHGEQPSAGH